MFETNVNILRYPGGKQRHLTYFSDLLPNTKSIKGWYFEPFVGGASVFFAVNPEKAILSDINVELIELYRGIKKAPKKVWEIYSSFPHTKKGYYQIRDQSLSDTSLLFRAARTLFLNRTCFKGMWRHNSEGKFNVGYGGQSRRWAINENSLIAVSKRLRKAQLKVSDFEPIIDQAILGDFIFLDPPYNPGEIQLRNEHYQYNFFTYEDHLRLAKALDRATQRGVNWLLTTSSHAKILELFEKYHRFPLSIGTGSMPGILIREEVGEALIMNWRNWRECQDETIL